MRRSVFSYLPLHEQPTLDAAAVEMTGTMVISHNPALGLPLETLGFFAFHYSASNVAVRFAQPKFIMVGINLPPKSTEKQLRILAKNLGDEAKRYNVKVVGGHAGVYKGLTIPLVSVTCLGRQVRRPVSPSPGDLVVLVGQVGAEAVWLRSLLDRSGDLNGREEGWRKLTPLPPSMKLSAAKDVRLMHDVSEGGVATALYEIAKDTGLKLDVKSDSIPYHAGAFELSEDPLRIPSYGVLIAIVDKDAEERILGLCQKMNHFCSVVGKITKGKGAYVDNRRIRSIKRTKLDQIYGSFTREEDETIRQLDEALMDLEEHAHISRLIPEVGTSMVYSKPRPKSLSDVAGLNGRVVVSLGRPKVCGQVTYGGSRHVGTVVIEAAKLNPEIRAAVNVKGRKDVINTLEYLDMKVCKVPPKRTKDLCPVATFIRQSRKLSEAYYHPGSQGIEPSIVILAKTPKQLLGVLIKASEYVGNNRVVQ